MKTVKRVRKFQIQKGNQSYDDLKELCLKSRNVYNTALYLLRHLQFASFPTNHDTEYYLSRIPENIRPFIESTTKTYKIKDTNEKKIITYYNFVVHSESGKKITDEKALYTIFLETNNTDYKAIQATAARNAIKLAYKDVKSFKKKLIRYIKEHPKDEGEPKLPRFKKYERLNPFIVDSFKINKQDRSITIQGNCKLNNVYLPEDIQNVKQIRVIPDITKGIFEVEIVYEKHIEDINTEKGWMGIDLGVNNLGAVTTSDGNGFLINGRALKNINHFFNKNVARVKSVYCENGNFVLKNVKDKKTGKINTIKIPKSGKKRRMLNRKRENKINTFMHQTSRAIIDFAVANNIGHIVVGHNKEWKQNCNLGRVTNQNFVQIPFNKLISQLKYKGEEYGIEVIETEEKYTSKCSALDKEEISKHETYVGKRGGKHNKEFITGSGKLINADINGSLNILRLGMKDCNLDIENPKKTILTPPKFNKIGIDKMQSQNLLNFSGDMAEKKLETTDSLKIKATVDSHNMEKSTFKKYIHLHM